MPTNATQLATLEARLTLIQTAITATLTRGVESYSTEIQSLKALGLTDLRRLESSTLNDIKRLERGSRFGAVGFKGVPG